MLKVNSGIYLIHQWFVNFLIDLTKNFNFLSNYYFIISARERRQWRWVRKLLIAFSRFWELECLRLLKWTIDELQNIKYYSGTWEFRSYVVCGFKIFLAIFFSWKKLVFIEELREKIKLHQTNFSCFNSQFYYFLLN